MRQYLLVLLVERIEGYRVTPELIRRVRIGTRNPAVNEQDREQRNAISRPATQRHRVEAPY
jgi:hypothetical protein